MSEERSSICESQSDWLGGSQTEEVSEMVRHSEKGDFDLPPVAGRTFRFRRSAHESRKCARRVRERIGGVEVEGSKQPDAI